MSDQNGLLPVAALELVERGYWVFPCQPRGKLPANEHGFHEATADAMTVKAIWDAKPRSNIGVACGASGITIFDIDSKNGADPRILVPRLRERLGDELVVVETGVAPPPSEDRPDSLEGIRGAQAWFRGAVATGDTEVKGCEFRSQGAYVLAPPSIHPSGVTYEGALPPLTQLPALPGWLAELVKRQGQGPAEPVGKEIPQGERDKTLASIAGSMRWRGMDAVEIYTALQVVNRRRCKPPLPEQQVAKIASSIGRYPTGDEESEQQTSESAGTDAEIRIVTAREFAAVDEPGADPLVGSGDQVLIPEGGDVMIYGDGGASKTTLGNDLGVHLATGEDWLGIEVPHRARVLLIEAEGPRPLYRNKIERKLGSWQGLDPGDQLLVWETPWAEFRFPDSAEIAEEIGDREIDVLIVGPLSRVGWDELGTLQEVREFMDRIADFRAQSGRRLTVVLIHHENKGGKVSGAFEAAGDTLLHAEVHSPGKTKLTIQKARWASAWHKKKLGLGWRDGESFEVVEAPERDLVSESREWLIANPHSTVKEIAGKKEIKEAGKVVKTIPGIGANETAVGEALQANPNVFRVRTGDEAKAVGRHPSSHVWEVK